MINIIKPLRKINATRQLAFILNLSSKNPSNTPPNSVPSSFIEHIKAASFFNPLSYKYIGSHNSNP